MNLSRPLFTFSLLIIVTATLPRPVNAAPFCVAIQGVPPECLYFDTNECKKRANELSGVCTVNPADFVLSKGDGRFCLVNSMRLSQCIYPDRATCDNAAGTANGICVDNTKVGVQPNPFANNPNQRY